MNNKAFTLVELLVTITLITLVSGLIIPNMVGIVNDSKEKSDKYLRVQIEEAALDWLNLYTGADPDPGETIAITLGDLKKEGLIDKKLINPKTKKKYPDDLLISIQKSDSVYGVVEYPVYDTWIITNSGTDQDMSLYKSTMVLKGKYRDSVEMNETYEDEGVLVYDSTGSLIPQSEITKIILLGSAITKESIYTSELNNYEIRYTAVVDGETLTKRRFVQVKDSVPPVISVPTNTIISTDVDSFDVMDGVFISDNSGNYRSYKTSNISLHVPGKYLVTYTAYDDSDNKTIKNRYITITDEVIN